MYKSISRKNTTIRHGIE